VRRTHKTGWLTIPVLAVFIVSGVQALGKDTVREPVVRFIDFYLAAQKADAPITLWERIAYGVALARTPSSATRSSK
jgi:hypothetical protein